MLHISTTISILLTILVAVLFYILRYFKATYSYWEKRNIPYLKPTIPFGNLSKVFTREWTLGQAFGELYLELKKRGVKHGGIFSLNKPTYIPVDPEIIKHIIISDADNFPNHGLYINTTDDPLSGHIFNMEGNRWKDLRTKLPKAFTCARMREMFVMIERFSEELHKLLETCRQKQNGINIKNELEKFTADVISLCGFGLESNAMKGQNEDLLKHSRTFFDYQWNIYKNSMVFGFSREVLKQFNFKIFPTETTKYVKDMFGKVKINRTEKNIERGDLANTIISLCERNEKYKDYSGKKVMDPLNDNEYVAQMWIFFCASFETSSSTLTFILYELSKNPEYQQKLRNEIETVLERYDNKITYDSIMEMKYLEQVIDETLRIYPVFPILSRVCKEDYPVPGTDLVLEKNTYVMVSNYGIQRDPEYYPDPLKFNPDRFSVENKGTRPFVANMPFGEGPRICIGKRFGLLQIKAALVTIVKNYKVSLNKKTTPDFRFDPWQLILRKSGDVWVNLERISY